MDVENAGAELMDISDGINELADQMAGVPFDAYVLAAGGVEEALPHGGLSQHVVIHERQVIGALRAMLEGDAKAALGRGFGDRFPKCEQLRDEILERLVNRMAATLIDPGFDHRAGKAADVFYAQVRRDFDGALPCGACEFRLARIERVAVIHTDCGNTDAESFGLRCELLGEGLPFGIIDSARAGVEAHPFDGAQAEPLRPFELGHFAADQSANSHDWKLPTWRMQSTKNWRVSKQPSKL